MTIKPKKPVKYMGVSLPIPFINEIRKYIANDERYRNVPQFVAAAVREKMNPPKTVNLAPASVNKLAIQISGELTKMSGYLSGDKSRKTVPIVEKPVLVDTKKLKKKK